MHDRALLDALEAAMPQAFVGRVWRVVRKGRSPLQGSVASGRWTPGDGVEALYTSLERDGALAEIGYRLSLEPIWPSRLQHEVHALEARTSRTLRFADVEALAALGVDAARYANFDYSVTQAIASAAHFLEFDGLVAPSARHASQNLVLFMDRIAPQDIRVTSSEDVDWSAWRRFRTR